MGKDARLHALEVLAIDRIHIGNLRREWPNEARQMDIPTVGLDRTWTDISAEADLSLEVLYRMLPVLEKQGEIRDTSDTVVLLDRSTRPRSPATKKSI